MDMSKYTEIFIEESREHLQSLNQNLLELEKNPKEVSLVNEVFRIAHTLKGMAGTMGFNRMTKLTHVMEDTLHSIRTGERKVDSDLLDLLFKCLDALEGYVTAIVNTGGEGEAENQEIINQLSGIVANEPSKTEQKPQVEEKASPGIAQSPNVTDSPASQGGYIVMELDKYDVNIIEKARILENYVYRVDISLDKGCLLKAARAFIFYQTAERHGEIVKSVPSAQDIEDEKFEFDISILLISKSTKNEIISDIERLSEVSDYSVEELDNVKNIRFKEDRPMNASSNTAMESSVTATPNIQAGIGGEAVAPNQITNEPDDTMAKQPEEEKQEATQVQTSNAKVKHNKTVRVDIERLDVLMNLVSELIIIKTGLDGLKITDGNENLGESLEYLERITTSLHDAVMKVRMVPVETVFNRFPRMIRDIARELKKDIVLEMSGEETELDRTVIDEIGDPLIHLLRNSVDHGIDSIEQRKARGKSEKGHIYLRAYPDGNNVIIEVEDDGQGINIEKVKKTAVSKGLVSRDVINTYTPENIINFLFVPGFSTNEVITDLSGRGVGLDVVKTKIESLGGMVEVNTELGVGTKFTIRLPLTLAIIQALLVLVGDEKYAIPLSSIKEIKKVAASDIKYVQKKEVMFLRDTILPIVWLEKMLDVEVDRSNPKKGYTVVVVKKGENLMGIVVDRLIGQQEIVIKSLGKLLSKLRIIAGATILGDGNVALILDVNSLQT